MIWSTNSAIVQLSSRALVSSSISSKIASLLSRTSSRVISRLTCIASHFNSSPNQPLYRLSSRTIASTVAAMSASTSSADNSAPSFPQTEDEWKKKLSSMEYAVLRQKHTEPGDNRGYTKEKAAGVYVCKGCEAPLYSSDNKFDSSCGWPAFWKGLPGAIKEIPDADGRRVEIVCNNCGSHLGHVFRGEGFSNPVDERHCVNSICLTMKKKKL